MISVFFKGNLANQPYFKSHKNALLYKIVYIHVLDFTPYAWLGSILDIFSDYNYVSFQKT